MSEEKCIVKMRSLFFDFFVWNKENSVLDEKSDEYKDILEFMSKSFRAGYEQGLKYNQEINTKEKE